ncbi:23S rRNA (guanosine2251-2'-O)-methyltransferase [Breznakia sp. PF5-3]|uniref:TrmH family RNA methyltransferase n=1 Tax=unclassified Breznakia TaxID=2623764 RepID=UPI002404FDED|nr:MULTISPECIES: RNA methyltransferase [unclassified Breznakia]MDF9824969.1 23S rRNA (guanosine2251-2'-O)-methyltransferase [Breznakia sp. PM6-1]MDF9835838.1 23S rRNA (guanosine2251-2'-O)-methyltransferase [Breznakia sp. PF5-3]MDF9836910.1 23S rRNA (guanosine2251-2'-O)-methyltransferase [Breznakia sp. PFB2-8]MDF9859856.1 23S rRNA (guanosine2251-2'-O)-methyltransferase [Breznakia sp. PH5-24]
MIFEGNISVKSALLSPHREVVKLFVDKSKKDRDTKFILRKAQEQNIEVVYCERQEIDKLAQGSTHGGLLCEVGKRTYQDLDDIIKEHSFIALVEGIEDPYNFGYIIRSLYAAGCDGIITNERNWSNAANVVAKASAGASEYIAHVSSSSLEHDIKQLRTKGIAIVCALRDDTAIEMYDYNFKKPVCICIGGEKRGLSKIITSHSDQNVFIPYNSEFKNALNAVSATTILAYELIRQRKHK